MAKWSSNLVLDAALNKIATSTQMIVCSQQPTTRTEAVSTYALASVSVTGSDFTIANGDTSGRKVTVAAKSNISVTASGTATHIALVDATDLLYVTTCTSQVLTAGNTVNTPAWKAEIASPT